MNLLVPIALLCATAAVASQEHVFGSPDTRFRSSQSSATQPVQIQLSALTENQFTSVNHHRLPGYELRIKRTPGFFCEETANSYTGYLDTSYGTKHFFFYFFESRSDPDKDDVVMWLNGGPGCASSTGLFMELGPCRIDGPNSTKPNPHSWNTNANVFFLDQPIGTGFSYAEFGQKVETTEEAARDINAFVALFFETFSKFKGRRFHLAGESYAGLMIPQFASHIVDSNAKAASEGRTPINIQSVLLGNGLTDVITMIPTYYDMLCTKAGFPVADISSCVKIKQAMPRCEQWTKEECVDRFDAIGCMAARNFCMSLTFDALFATGRNVYNLAQDCDGAYEDTLCYPITQNIEHYLNLPATREILGVDPSVGQFSDCNMNIFLAFEEGLDRYHTSPPYVAQLLERGIRVLVYVGANDFICNHVGNYKWVQALDWAGNAEFQGENLRNWTVDARTAGETKSARGLTWATIFDAGHMSPYDKPVETLKMLQRWMADEPL